MASLSYIDPSFIQPDLTSHTADFNWDAFDAQLLEEERHSLLNPLDLSGEFLGDGGHYGGESLLDTDDNSYGLGGGPDIGAPVQSQETSTQTGQNRSDDDLVAHETGHATGLGDFTPLWDQLPSHPETFCPVDHTSTSQDYRQRQEFSFGHDSLPNRLDIKHQAEVEVAANNLLGLPSSVSEDTSQELVQKVVDGVIARLSSVHLSQSFKPQDEEPLLSGRAGRSGHDSDSGQSWDEQDSSENFYRMMEQALEPLRDFESGNFFVTNPLPPRKRRVVHGMAHLKRLNHMTLDKGRDRRILVSTDNIVCPEGVAGKHKCWNERRANRELDPTSLVLKFPDRLSQEFVFDVMASENLPISLKWKVLQFPDQAGEKSYAIQYDSPSDAATVWEAMDDFKFRDGPTLFWIEATYRAQDFFDGPLPGKGRLSKSNRTASRMSRRRPSRHRLSSSEADPYLSSASRASSNQLPGQGRTSTPYRSSVNRVRRGPSRRRLSSTEADGYGSSASRASSKRSFAVYMSDATTNKEAGSFYTKDGDSVHTDITRPTRRSRSELEKGDQDVDLELVNSQISCGIEWLNLLHDTDPDLIPTAPQDNPAPAEPPEYCDEDPQPKRRRRLPKLKGEYKCREQGCDKVFDYNGERTKHERIHRPESERPHACQYCEKRFIDKKDAARHELVHLRKWLPGK